MTHPLDPEAEKAAGDLADLPLSSLIPRLARSHRAHVYDPLKRLGLVPGQELLLMRLWDHGPQRQSSLAAFLEISAPTVAKMVTRLEHAGFVTRTRAPDDTRAVLVSLADRGEAVRADVEALWSELEERTTRSLGPQEQRMLRDVLARLIADLQSPS